MEDLRKRLGANDKPRVATPGDLKLLGKVLDKQTKNLERFNKKSQPDTDAHLMGIEMTTEVLIPNKKERDRWWRVAKASGISPIPKHHVFRRLRAKRTLAKRPELPDIVKKRITPWWRFW